MRKVVLKIRGKTLREFPSFCQCGIYLIDIFTKVGIIVLFAFASLAGEIIQSPRPSLSTYLWICIIAIIVWGLLLIKFIILRKKVFGKTKFDLYFMGILTVFLISTLFAEDRVRPVFGSFGTWSYSVITLLSVSILYYITALTFRYARGVKWLSLGFLLSYSIPAVYYAYLVLQDRDMSPPDYLTYAVFSIPIAIGIIFILRKIVLKIVAFIGLLFSLFLVAFYANYLQGSMFMLGIGVLALFLLLYFSFWVKNIGVISEYLKSVFTNIRSFAKLKKTIVERKREGLILLMMALMALWIIGLAVFNWRYYKVDIRPEIGDWLREGLDKMEGSRMWLIGDPDLSSKFSSIEVLNVLGSYGIFAMLSYAIFLGYLVYVNGKMTLKFLYSGSFRNVILLSSMFVTSVSILFNFLLSRFTPMIYLLLVLVTALFAIITSLIDKESLYSLEDCVAKVSTKEKIVQVVAVILIIGLVAAGVAGVLLGLDKGLFWVS